MNPRFAGRRILLSGAGGFIGGHLARRLLADGAEVTALTRSSCDLTDEGAIRSAVSDARPEVIMHLAAARAGASAAERIATAAVNITSGQWLIEAAGDQCSVAIRLGSSTEYGASADPMDEDTPLLPRGFFGATKAAGSLLFTATAAERGMRSCLLRAFQVYGPRDKPGRFVPTVLRAARSGAVVDLTVPGMRRDWIFVDDVVEACVLAACADELPTGSTFNLGSQIQTSNEELVAIAEMVTGARIRTRVGTHPGRGWDSTDWVCDASAARSELGWKPRFGLSEGLARCWEQQ